MPLPHSFFFTIALCCTVVTTPSLCVASPAVTAALGSQTKPPTEVAEKEFLLKAQFVGNGTLGLSNPAGTATLIAATISGDILTTHVAAGRENPPANWRLKLPEDNGPNTWLRILRLGDVVTTAYSGDGVKWTIHICEPLPELPTKLNISTEGKINHLTLREKADAVDNFIPIAADDFDYWSTLYGAGVYENTRIKNAVQTGRFAPLTPDNPLGYHPGVPPWKPVYKSPAPLIPDLDIPGPDGLVYPNFSYAGVQGGIPKNLPIRVTLSPDSPDFAADLEAAVQKTSEAGGGVVQLEEGTFKLTRPVTIARDKIVLRGRGPALTKIQFAYGLKPKTLRWFSPATDDSRLGPQDRIEVHADLDSPAGSGKVAGELRLLVDDRVMTTTRWTKDVPYIFRASVNVRNLLEQNFSTGPHTVTAEVVWRDGTTTKESRRIILDPATTRPDDVMGAEAALLFTAASRPDSAPLVQSLERGDRQIRIPARLPLQVGDYISLRIGADPDWMRLVKAVTKPNGSSWLHRMTVVQVSAIKDGQAVFNQPLRIPFEAAPGATITRLDMLQYCGVEDLAIEMTEPIWINAVSLRYVANSWIRNVHFLKAGRNPFGTDTVKWIEIRDIEADDAWFKLGGGTAYISFDRAFDSLMDGIKGSRLRHAPNFQWSTSGCVIRNGDFNDSDGQLHAGWPSENLLENCTITSRRGNGSYGYGFFVQAPESDSHGPQGPRNVLYNNDIRSPLAGLWLGGSNEAYQILYNRFTVEQGPAVIIKQGSFDHTLLGNVFITKNPGRASILVATPDCVGIDVINNTFVGLKSTLERPAAFVGGAVPPASMVDNRAYAYSEKHPRPAPSVPSLYLWQKKHLSGSTQNPR